MEQTKTDREDDNMNDLTNTVHSQAPVVNMAKKLLERKPGLQRKLGSPVLHMATKGGSANSTPVADKLNLSDLRANSTPNGTPGSDVPGLGEFLFEGGSGDESSLASSLNSQRMSVGTPNSITRHEIQSPSKVLGSMSATKGATLRIQGGAIPVVRRELSDSSDGNKFLWESYAPGAAMARHASENAVHEDTAFKFSTFNPEQSGVSITDAQRSGRDDESFGEFVSGDDALRVLQEGDASYNSEHKFSIMSSQAINDEQQSSTIDEMDEGTLRFSAKMFEFEETVAAASALVHGERKRHVAWEEADQTVNEDLKDQYFQARSMPLGSIDGTAVAEDKAVRFDHSDAQVKTPEVNSYVLPSKADYSLPKKTPPAHKQSTSKPEGPCSLRRKDEGTTAVALGSNQRAATNEREGAALTAVKEEEPAQDGTDAHTDGTSGKGTKLPSDTVERTAKNADAADLSAVIAAIKHNQSCEEAGETTQSFNGTPFLQPDQPVDFGVVEYGKICRHTLTLVHNGFHGHAQISVKPVPQDAPCNDRCRWGVCWDSTEGHRSQQSETATVGGVIERGKLVSSFVTVTFATKRNGEPFVDRRADDDIVVDEVSTLFTRQSSSRKGKKAPADLPQRAFHGVLCVAVDMPGGEGSKNTLLHVPFRAIAASKNCLQVPPGMKKMIFRSPGKKSPCFLDLPVRNGGANTLVLKARVVPLKSFPRSSLCFTCDSAPLSLHPGSTDGIRVLYTPLRKFQQKRGSKAPGPNVDRAKLVIVANDDREHTIFLRGDITDPDKSARSPRSESEQQMKKKGGSRPAPFLICQETNIQFGPVTTGTCSEAILSIRSIVDFDVSVHCRVTELPVAGADMSPRSFKVTSPEVFVLKGKSRASVVVHFTPVGLAKSRAFVVLTSSHPAHGVPMQLRLAVGGCGKARPRRAAVPTGMKVIKSQNDQSHMSYRRGQRNQALVPVTIGSRPVLRKKTRRRNPTTTSSLARRKPAQRDQQSSSTSPAMLLQKEVLSTRLRFDQREVCFGDMPLGRTRKKTIILSNPSDNDGNVSMGIRDRTSPFQVCDRKTCQVFLHAKESVGIEIRYVGTKLGISHDCLVAWRGSGGGNRVTLPLSGKVV